MYGAGQARSLGAIERGSTEPGFLSADHPDEAYIHFVGVDPRCREDGVARALYERFFEEAAAVGRTKVKAVASPANAGAIAFHRAMGFDVHEPQAGHDHVRFEKRF
ncbi:GNAT family N-acetyltransferase [Actinomadura opuntiae]|uniref:GNAT family N-acetyltransferase n=1 Tax=Actinomadura sp. OS1-43 TaxID=604315 RepID=UPI00255B089F|nr:GNAT family N-acetyltransferase [Actinomadura sp. OS1-43]MDL4821226.1 GNAT family N-acetyltransferase [Actinomadura sp. OS1-43]